MSIVFPSDDILGARTNEAGVVYDPLDKTRIYAEELNALYARAVAGTASTNQFSVVVSGSEALTEDKDAMIRGIWAEGSVGAILKEGAGSRLLYYPGKKAFRVGEVTGTAWDDANVGVGSVGVGVDVEAAHAQAVVIGSGVDDANRLATVAVSEIILGQGSDVPTLRVSAATGVGTVGLTGIGLGATLPTALADIGASTTARATIRLRPGADPSVPNDGDLWINGTTVKARLGGVTQNLNGAGGALPAPGAAGKYLRSDGAIWKSDTLDADDVGAGKVAALYGGTGQGGGYGVGDLLYASAAAVLSKRAVGAVGQVLGVVGSLPTWVAVPLPPNNSITYAIIQDVSAASRLLGRGSAGGAGDPEEIVLGTNLTMSGTTLNAAGGGSLMMFWGPQAGALGNNQTVYAYMAGAPAITATESLSQIRMPACTILGLSGNNSVHGTDYTITVRKNGAGTAMTTGLVSSIANHFRITTGAPLTFADGDLLALQIVMAAGGPGSTFRGLFLEVKLT